MYHFIGIKGSGMSALALIMKSLGMDVKGSDVDKHFFTEDGLRENNIEVTVFDEKNIKEGMEIIQGNAFHDDNIEVKKARELGLKIYTYQQMVGKLSTMFKTISVSGCHGKTTTTSMLSHVINNICGCNYLIGDGTGHANQENEYFALEACEYKRHFLEYTQEYAVITNIDLDHVDYYKDIDDVIDAYRSFALNTKKRVIACGDDLNVRKLNTRQDILHYGFNEENDVIAKNIEYYRDKTEFDVYINNELYDRFTISLTGNHLVLNALAVISVCYLEGLNKEDVKKHLSTFKGAKRRFSEEEVGTNIVIDDYAHHPSEIRATIEAVRQKYPDKKIISVFQPHTFTRTIKFSDAFADALNESDEVYVLKIHASRESASDYETVDSNIIISKLKNGHNIDSNNADVLLKYENSVILFMAPNDISILENDYKSKKKEGLK